LKLTNLTGLRIGQRLPSWGKDSPISFDESTMETLAQIKTLSGVVPICSHCKKIRDDEGYWNQFEAFVASHTEARVTHGICPECMAKLYPEYVDKPGEAESKKQPGATGPESR